jgi:hypothetical protein
LFGQSVDSNIVDIVWLKDGSKLTGTILKWELQHGMEFKLVTGAVMEIPKEEIRRVSQDIPLNGRNVREPIQEIREPKVYDFKEKGWYQNTSGFINTSFNGGAGIHHVMGYRFNRMLGIGLGTGVETHDFSSVRNIIPIYAEARGFLLPKKITPYYALKIGYGIALKERQFFDEGGSESAKGGFHFSPELGVRFGAGDVSYYLGLEYKIQNASYRHQDFFGGGAVFTDKISYRRIEIRTGLLF